MSVSVVLGVQDAATSEALDALLADESGFTVRAVGSSPESLVAAVLDHEPDAVLLHEDFGPAPALTVARDLVSRLPWVSIVLLTHEPSTELYAAAGDAGIRSLASLPPSLSDLTARLTAAAWWSRTVRLGSEARRSYDESGTVLTVAGAKGGVGTTTIATQLAFVAAAANGRRVCLVDLDLFGPDLAAYLATDPARSIRELVDLSDELSPGVVQPVLYPHESGVRVLFAPEDVTEAELVSASVVRRALGVLRTMFDVVVVDCGSQVAESTLPAVELADRLALVATPDLLSLRAAHRRVEAWELLDARRRDAVEIVLNRVSKNAAVQPRLVGQTSAVRVLRTGVPAAFGALEQLVNEGATGVRHQRTLSRPLTALALHFGVLPPPPGRFVPLWRWGRRSATAVGEASAPSGGTATPARSDPTEHVSEPAVATPIELAGAATADPGGGEAGVGEAGVGDRCAGTARRRGTGEEDVPVRPVAEAASTDSGTVPVEVAAVGVVLTLGVYLLTQLVAVAWTAAVLALATPAAAEAVAAGAAAEEVQADLRSGDSPVLDGIEVTHDGDRVVVSVPTPVVLGVPGLALDSLSSDARVVMDDEAAS